LDMSSPQMTPCHNIPGTLVYQASGKEVNTTIVNGNIVMEDRQFPLIEKKYGSVSNLLAKAQEASNAIVERAGLQRLRDRSWRSL